MGGTGRETEMGKTTGGETTTGGGRTGGAATETAGNTPASTFTRSTLQFKSGKDKQNAQEILVAGHGYLTFCPLCGGYFEIVS